MRDHYTLLLEVPARGLVGNMTSANHNKGGRPLGSIHKRGTAGSYPFFGSVSEKPAEIHHMMNRQYGDAYVSLQQVYE
jgi:hypothetical protein